MRQSKLTIALAVVLSVPVCGTASSQQPAGSDMPPAKELLLRGPPQDDTARRLTRDQIKSCMRKAVELGQHEERLKEPGLKIEQQRRELEARDDDLKRAKLTLNRRSEKAVAEFNIKVAALNAAQKAFNVSVNNLNAEHEKGQPLIHAYNVDCAGRPFSPTDEAATRAELGLKENPMKQIQSR